MQFENINANEINIHGLHKYEIAISEMFKFKHNVEVAASTYGLNTDYLSMFYYTIVSGKVVKSVNKNLTFLDELAFLLYLKIHNQALCLLDVL